MNCNEDENELHFYTLTDDEIEVLSLFSKLNKRYRARIVERCTVLLAKQLFDEYKECTDISISTKKDSRFTFDK